MKKLNTDKNILQQITKNEGKLCRLDSMQAYINKIDNVCNIYSYDTKIGQYDIKTNILYLTTKKYSITTTKQQNKIKNNFIKYQNAKLEAL